MKIEFGCGENPTKKGFLTCDIRNLPNVDFICSAWKIKEYVKDGTVNEIFSRHFFEHLTFKQGEDTLQIWYDILKPNGICGIMLPNMEFHIKQWIKEKDLEHSKAGFWGWQRGEFDEVWDVHKSGYNRKQLTKLMQSKGFKNIKTFYPDNHHHLYLEGTK